MKVIPTKNVLIKGKRVRAGTPIDVKLKKGHKLPHYIVPIDKVPKAAKEIDTLSELGKAQAKSAKDLETT